MSEIPRAIRLLWDPDDQPRRGPKPKLSVGDIATAGVAVADADGLNGVSMASVAKRLGVTTMALYRYVDTKETLLAVMLDVAYGAPPEAPDERPWREAIKGWATTLLAALREHPWVVHVRLATPPLGPNTLGWMNRGIEILSGAGLADAQAAASALLVIDGYVRNQVQMEQQYVGDSAGSWGDMLRELLPDDGYPLIRAGLEAGIFDDEPDDDPFPGDQFGFGLDLVLGGVERLVEAPGSPPRQT